MTNKELIQKADLALSDLAAYGKLNPEQSDAFIRKLIAQPTVLRDGRIVRMGAPERKIDKLGFGSRIMRPGVSATALSAGDRSKPDIGGVTLTTKEGIAEVRIPYDVIEDAIERGDVNFAGPNSDPQAAQGGIKDAILDRMAARAALDLEEAAIQGDTASGDAWLANWDGYLKLTTSNVVNASSAGISRLQFKRGMQTMPDQYLRDPGSMRHYVAVDQEIEYRDNFANRETARGDAVAEGDTMVAAFGPRVAGVSMMPTASGLLTNPQNLIWGIQRDISIEVDKDITSRVFIIVLTIRCDFKIEEEEAVVKYTNFGSPV